MAWSYSNPLVRTGRDGRGQVRLIRHLQHPFPGGPSAAKTRALVVSYLEIIGAQLGLPTSAAEHLNSNRDDDQAQEGPPSASPGVQLRWRPAFLMRDETTVVLLQQTYAEMSPSGSTSALDVEGAGLRIFVHQVRDAVRITSVDSTLELGSIDLPTDDIVQDLADPTIGDVLLSFGLGQPASRLTSPPMSVRFIHRYRPSGSLAASEESGLTAGRFYTARRIRVSPGAITGKPPFTPYELTFWQTKDWAAPSNLDKHTIVPLRMVRLTAGSGTTATDKSLVFTVDPVTASADFDHVRPNASTAKLDPHRQKVDLLRLTPPGPGGEWTLSGQNVDVVDTSIRKLPDGLGAPPPSNPDGPVFKHHARTNEFAAVNAYFHLDMMLAMLDRFGLPFKSFPMGYVLPVQVIHRAVLHPGPAGDGKGVNGQTQIATIPPSAELNGIQFLFGLADLSRNPGSIAHPVEPLGIACDSRIVWHEFCHGLIAAATGYLEFPFCHSAGDALAAIQCDPASAIAGQGQPPQLRFVTYPWAGPPRKHGRDAADGWSWMRPLGHTASYAEDIRDMFGYMREQIMSSTLFRLYQALGGDATHAGGAPDIVARRVAADYTTYLIVRAINSLGSGTIVPALDAGAFATSVAEADIGTDLGPILLAGSAPWVGGVAHKIVEWAFKQQGLPPPDTSAGVAPDDVYFEDGRAGDYMWTLNWEAVPAALWIRNAPDGLSNDTTPIRGAQNYVYAALKNSGGSPAANATISVYVAKNHAHLQWPSPEWVRLAGAPAAILMQSQAAIAYAMSFGPWAWRPTTPGDYAVLAIADSDGDLSNLNPAGGLACASQPSPVELLVRLDNNLGLRVVHVA